MVLFCAKTSDKLMIDDERCLQIGFDHLLGQASRSKVRSVSVSMCQNYVARVKNDCENFFSKNPKSDNYRRRFSRRCKGT